MVRIREIAHTQVRPERQPDPEQHVHGGLRVADLDPRQVWLVDACHPGDGTLRETRILTHPPHVIAESPEHASLGIVAVPDPDWAHACQYTFSGSTATYRRWSPPSEGAHASKASRRPQARPGPANE